MEVNPMANFNVFKILIVEDEPMLAYSLEENLIESGFEIVGIAYKVDDALNIIKNTVVDAAILDVNLHGSSAYPVALSLTTHSIPFIIVSGYSSDQIKEEFPTAIFIQKPYRPNIIIEQLQNLLTIN
jgi:DNA-binding response OmpR family regulator